MINPRLLTAFALIGIWAIARRAPPLHASQ